jgi:hypothetical protein
MKPQECLPDDYLITFAQDLRTSGQQTPSAIYERAIRRAKILDHVNVVTINYSRVTP